MYNITFRISDPMMEIKVISALENECVRWTKRGSHIEVIGVSENMKDVIMSCANKYWCW